MPRPCHAEHSPSPSWCPLCQWCIKPGVEAMSVRQFWGEPEPNGHVAFAPSLVSSAMRRDVIDKYRGVPCKYLGEETGETRKCVGCGNQHKQASVKRCAKHGVCTQLNTGTDIRCCLACDDYTRQEVVGLDTRDLVYHCHPIAGNGIWQRNIAHLLKRVELFNGKRVIAVTVGPGLDPPCAVDGMLLGHHFETLTIPNNPGLREGHTLVPLLERIASNDPGRAFFYAHAKGVTRPVNPGVTVHPWTDMLYETLLDYWPVVENVLVKYPLAGSFKKHGAGFQGSQSRWHYSGSFFWARSADFFSRNWQVVEKFWATIEAYPSTLFADSEAGVIFHEGNVYATESPAVNLYDMAYLQNTVYPDYAAWKESHRKWKTSY